MRRESPVRTHVAKRLGGRRQWIVASRGQSLVELAIAIPVLCLLLCAAIDVGRLAYMAITLNDAARAGAEYGAQSLVTASDNAGMQCTARQDGKDAASILGQSATGCSCVVGSASSQVPCGVSATSNTTCYCPNGSQVKCGDGLCSDGTQSVYVTVTASATFSSLTRILPMPSSFAVSGTATRRVGNP